MSYSFKPAPLPADELGRLAALARYDILDTPEEQAFDDIATIARAIFSASIAAVSFMDANRQWFKSMVGMKLREIPRSISMFAYALLEPDRLLEIEDARADDRFAGHPIVQNTPNVRFYLSMPITAAEGAAIGTLCIMDNVPRKVSGEQCAALHALVRQLVGQLELKRAVVGLERDGLTDPLTGAWNRRGLDRRLAQEWTLRLHNKGSSVALLMVDLDHFKRINDEFGHPAGDAALRVAAQCMQRCVRRTDMVARFGGEEFIVLLSDCHLDAALRIAENIRTSLARAEWPDRPVTASVGVATAVPSERACDPAALVSLADQAVYEAKRLGRDRVQSQPAAK